MQGQRLRRAVFGVSAASFVALASELALYFGKLRPESLEEERAARVLVEDPEADLAELRRSLEEQRRAVDDKTREVERLEREAREAKSQAERREAETRLGKAQRTLDAARRPRVAPAEATAEACTCDPKDPMCGCFR